MNDKTDSKKEPVADKAKATELKDEELKGVSGGAPAGTTGTRIFGTVKKS